MTNLTTAAQFDAVRIGEAVTWFDGWQNRSGEVMWLDEWRIDGDRRYRTVLVREDGAWNCIEVVRHDEDMYVTHSTTTGAHILAHGGTLDEFLRYRAEFEATGRV